MNHTSYKKSGHYLFTPIDEADFSARVTDRFPSTAFIDDMYWPTPTPPAKPTISDCNSKYIFMWPTDIYPILPYEKRKDGRFHGPQAGMVVQVGRPRIVDKNLLSGEMAFGVSVSQEGSDRMLEFAKGVWKIFRSMGTRKAVQVDPVSKQVLFSRNDILVGGDAAKWCRADPDRFFMFNNSPLIFMRPLQDK